LESHANHQIFWFSGFLDADFIASFIKNEQSNFWMPFQNFNDAQ